MEEIILGRRSGILVGECSSSAWLLCVSAERCLDLNSESCLDAEIPAIFTHVAELIVMVKLAEAPQ